MVLWACGGLDRGGPSELALDTEALVGETGQPADSPAACSAADLSWGASGGECSANWEYERRGLCWQDTTAAATPHDTSACTQWNNCDSWCFQHVMSGWTNQGNSPSFTAVRECERECTEDSQGRIHCGHPICESYFSAAQTVCADTHLPPAIAAKQATLPADKRALVQGRGTPVLVSGNTYKCKIELNYPRPGPGTGSLCGCMTTTRYTPVACDTRPTTGQRIYSSAGLTRSELLAEDSHAYNGSGAAAAKCTSCEQLPANTGDEVREKFSCLCNAWNKIPGTNSCSLTPPAQAESSRLGAIRDVGSVIIGTDLVFEVDPGNSCTNRIETPRPRDQDIVDFRGQGAGQLNSAQIPALVRHFRLLMELGGDHLPEHARTFLRGLYAQYKDTEHECSAAALAMPSSPPGGMMFEVPPSCPAPLGEQLETRLSRCEHFGLPHTADELSLIELPACLTLLDELNTLAGNETACDGPELRRAARQATTTMLAKALKLLERAPSTAYGSLPRQLHALSGWWGAFARSHAHDAQLDPDDDSRGDPHATLSELLGRFWDHATEGQSVLTGLRTTLGQPDPSAALVEAALDTANENASVLDRNVLLAALSSVTSLPEIVDNGTVVLPTLPVNGTPLRGLPLLMVLGDGLHRLGARLESLTELHDFACRFTNCRATGFSSPTERLTALMAALASSSQLSTELAATPSTIAGRDIFAAFSSSYPTFQAALQELGISDLDAPLPAGVHAAVQALVSVIGAQRERIAAFRSRGLFDATERRSLHAGVDDLVRSRVLSRMNTRLGQLASEQQRYEDSLQTLAEGLLNQAGAQQSADAIVRQQNELLDRLEELRTEVEGLQGSGDAERLRLGDITAQLANLEGAIDEGALLQVGDTIMTQLTGADATFVPQPEPALFADIAALSVVGETMDGVRMMAVEARGQWSPTCGLQVARALLPDPSHPGQLSSQELPWQGALTGPEGFMVTQSQGEALVESSGSSHESGWSHTTGNRFELCGSFGIDVGQLIGGIFGPAGNVASAFSLGVSARDCGVREDLYTTRDTNTSSTTSSTDVRSTASYATGLRLPYMPVPEAPVGSLVAVITPRGATRLSVEHEKHVISAPYTTVVIPQDSDVHFIVNDIGCPVADTLNDLEVTVRPLASVGDIAEDVVAQMAATIGDVRARELELRKQGTILPNQLQQIRSASITALETRSGLPFVSLPSPLQNLFATYLDLALLDLERRVEIDARERTMRRLRNEFLGLTDDLAHVERRGRLSLLVPLWRLHALPQRHLGAAVTGLVDDVEDYLLPIMELWYPSSVLGGSSAALDAAVEELLDATPSTRFPELVGRLVTVVQDALTRFEDAEAWNRPYDTHSIGALSWELPPAQMPTGIITKSPFRRAAVIPGNEVPTNSGTDPWTAVREMKTAFFRVTPEELYSRSGGSSGVLWCQEAVPVVSRMALFVARSGSSASSNDALNGQKRWISGRASSVRFQTESGIVPYNVERDTWSEFKIPVIFGTPGNAIAAFDQLIGQPASVHAMGAAGMSPFADYAIDFSGLAEARSNDNDTDGFMVKESATSSNFKFVATEMILVMKLDSRTVAAPVTGVNRCLPPAPPAPPPPPAPTP